MRKSVLMSVMVVSIMMVYSVMAETNPSEKKEILNELKWLPCLSPESKEAGSTAIIDSDGTFRASVKKGSAGFKEGVHHVQFNTAVDLEIGKEYKLSFKLDTDANTLSNVAYFLSKPPYTFYFKKLIKFDKGEAEYSCQIIPKSDDGKLSAHCILSFMLETCYGANIAIRDIKLKEKE
ncbi:MAG: hypothetical protein WAX69_04435 [Victivallales bacterium]